MAWRDARPAVSSRCTVELEEEREREHLGGGETSVYVLLRQQLHSTLFSTRTLNARSLTLSLSLSVSRVAHIRRALDKLVSLIALTQHPVERALAIGPIEHDPVDRDGVLLAGAAYATNRLLLLADG